MTSTGRRGIPMLDGAETSVATARVDVRPAARSAPHSMKGQVVPGLARLRKLKE